MIPYLNGVPVSVGEKTRLKQYLNAVPVTLEFPLEPFDWLDFIQAVKAFMGRNFLEFVMLLAGAMSAFHYQRVLSVVGECFIKGFEKQPTDKLVWQLLEMVSINVICTKDSKVHSLQNDSAV